MTLSKIATYVSAVVFLAASFHLAPGHTGTAGSRAQAVHTARSSK